MRTSALFRLSATTRLGDASLKASPCLSPRPRVPLRREASTYTRCPSTSKLLKQGSSCCKRWPYKALPSSSPQRLDSSSRRHFSHTPRTLNNHTTPPLGSSSQTTANDGPPPQSQPSPHSRKRTLIHIAFITSLFAGVFYYANEKRRARFLLNDERFMPCRVISNEPVSPTAFVLTIVTPITSLIETPNTTTTRDVLERAWAHGLWSLEFKQPQLQIARNYTPLPPLPDEEDAMTEEEKRMLKVGFCRLRFYMRRYDGGEVSTYLSRLQEGDEVEIRGPHLGFDIDARLGGDAGGKLVFLAGGTGIAPALQAATTVLQRRGDVDVDILWANRSSADCAGCPRLGAAAAVGRGGDDAHLDASPLSPIMRQLQALQAAYAQKGRTLRVQCVVDEEGSKVRPQDITRAISVGGRRATAAAAATSSTCSLHSQQQLEHSTEADDAKSIVDTSRKAGGEDISRGPERRRCNCPSEEGGRGGAGKNLFMISGPDGFVGAYVGPKVWAEGAERQGRVGGVVANLMRKDPKTWEKWLVLKQ